MAEQFKLPEFPYADAAESIRDRMLNKVSDEWDKSEGGFVFDALSPAAVEMQLAYERARDLLKWGFAVTTYGEYLDLKAAERGLTRRQAVKAQGALQITGEPGTVIPAGSVFSTEVDQESEAEPITFVSLDTRTLPLTEPLKIEAVRPGAIGNVPAGSIKVVVSRINGLTGVTNPSATTMGTDVESDEKLLTRLLDQVRNPGASGNIADYVKWAREADPLVGKVRVLPLANGNGTVKVIITDIQDKQATPELISKVQAYIDPPTGDGASPIGAAVTVATPSTTTVYVKVKLTIMRGYDEAAVKANVGKALGDYLSSLVLNTVDNDVRFSKVGSIIGNTDGVQDYENLAISVNGTTWGTANIVIADDAMAVMGNVTWLQ